MKYVFLPENSLIGDGYLHFFEDTILSGNSSLTKLTVNGSFGVGPEFDVRFQVCNADWDNSDSYVEILDVLQSAERIEVILRVSGANLKVKKGDVLARAIITERVTVRVMPKVVTETLDTPVYALEKPAKKPRKKR
jgi:hypothetical protein